MNCPEFLVFGRYGLWVWLYWRDVPRNMVPTRVWINPLRYQVSFTTRKGKRLFLINRDGRWWGRLRWFFLCKWRAVLGDKS